MALDLLDNPLVVPAYPRYLSGFVHALEAVPELAALDAWTPPWRMPETDPFAASRAKSVAEFLRGTALFTAHPATCDAVAELLGCDGGWVTAAGPSPAGAVLATRHPATAGALESLLAVT